jgi:hypothetical protein
VTACDKHQLLGTYTTPNVPEGAMLYCEYKKRWIPVECYSDGAIPWPMGRRPGTPAYGYIVFGDLARAISQESATTVHRHWGMSIDVVTRMRRALCVPAYNAGTRALKAAVMTDGEGRRRVAHMRGVAEGEVRPWSAAEDEAVMTLSVREAMARTGRTRSAVRSRRDRLTASWPADRPVGFNRRRRWGPEDDSVVLRMPFARGAKKLGCSVGAVRSRHRRLLRSAQRNPSVVQPPSLGEPDVVDRAAGSLGDVLP